MERQCHGKGLLDPRLRKNRHTSTFLRQLCLKRCSPKLQQTCILFRCSRDRKVCHFTPMSLTRPEAEVEGVHHQQVLGSERAAIGKVQVCMGVSVCGAGLSTKGWRVRGEVAVYHGVYHWPMGIHLICDHACGWFDGVGDYKAAALPLSPGTATLHVASRRLA